MRLTTDAVMNLPELLLRGLSWKEVAAEAGIAKSTLSSIFAGHTHKHIQPALQKRLAEVRAELRQRQPPPMKICTKCGGEFPRTAEFFQPVTRGEGFEARCLTCKRKQNKDRYQAVRLEVLRHYSRGTPICECCGEPLIEFLSIDHLNGGGTAHRRRIRGKYPSIYLWLKRNKFPKGYRVLCMNCNTAIGFHGYCPHQKQRED